MNKNTVRALEMMLKGEYDKDNPVATFRDMELGQQLVTAHANDIIIYQGNPVDYIWLLLSGRTQIINSIDFSTNDILSYVCPPHMLGLQEAMLEIPTYTAYVVADATCVLFRVPAPDFMEILRKNAELCYSALSIEVKVATENMELSETHRIFPKKDVLGRYLYVAALNNVPYTFPLTREKLSEMLNINLRSLYRYIDQLGEEGYLSIRKGRIIINEDNLRMLTERYENVVM